MSLEHRSKKALKLRVNAAALPTLGDEVGDAVQADSRTCEQLNVTPRTLFEWDRNEEMLKLGWEPATRIRGRKYRSIKKLSRFYQRLKKQHAAKAKSV